ncbi:hypothetical protein B0H10DRAFT_383724 [Mycena sp. CBHHK59/15]|nr:hypothetical protein B0H10DRAFT_383724 [Mycena sp. CBHHK59/15]
MHEATVLEEPVDLRPLLIRDNHTNKATLPRLCGHVTDDSPGLQHKWLAPSKPPASPPEAKPLGNSSLPRAPLARPPRLPPGVSRSPTGSGLVPSLSVKSDGTRSPPSFLSASYPSSVSFVKSLRISRPTSVSSRRPSWLFRKPPKLISSPFLRTPI